MRSEDWQQKDGSERQQDNDGIVMQLLGSDRLGTVTSAPNVSCQFLTSSTRAYQVNTHT